MSKRSPTIFISAAEASGDLHAAHLIEALRERLPGSRFVGVGGPHMAAAGCEPPAEGLFDLTRHASMLGGPLLRLGYYYRTVRRLRRAIAEIRPDLHIPVDSPALNWHLAGAAKKAGAKVVYYIAPQVWAWAPWRVQKLIRLTDHVACILPFEQEWLRERGVSATYVGHPLFDALPARPDPAPDLMEAWSEGTWRVALLPGSRPGEIRQHTRALAATAADIRRRWSRARCTFAAGGEQSAQEIRRSLPTGDSRDIEIAVDRTHEVLARSHFAVTVSGTITLEVAYFGVPMVVFYRVGRAAYGMVGRWLIRTPHLSLVNILSARTLESAHGRKIVPELMPWYGSVKELSSMVLEVMDDLGYLLELRRLLPRLTDPLRTHPPQSASGNAADLIAGVLEGDIST